MVILKMEIDPNAAERDKKIKVLSKYSLKLSGIVKGEKIPKNIIEIFEGSSRAKKICKKL